MTTLRDPFATVHKKDIKNKRGEVVAQVDYVGWAQSADRLDEVVEGGWSFSIMGMGEDWVHGRLTIGDRHFENVGYAENADMEWKKEVLKDAASDAFKRCAALAGVARYLYDKDAPRSGNGSARPSAPRPVAPVQRPTVVPSDGDLLGGIEDEDIEALHGSAPVDEMVCAEHRIAWKGERGDRFHAKPEGGWCRHPDNVQKARAAGRR